MKATRPQPSEKPSLTTPILVKGNRRVVITGSELVALPAETRRLTISCASGTRHTATWAGVPVLDLLETAGVSVETTHVVVESEDDYRICVDMYAALDGILAYMCDGTPLPEVRPYETRFVAPDIDGARTVKAVRSVEPVQLAPETDPESLEDLPVKSSS
ncbi:molybdopterin-dependent oxidoreductase [Halogeometricum borinquense]|uniref:Molybdopterin-dependent oxidoreductase n=1 Tax=Halogeometricum borinquense TaxID=60847 RepID=A0A6C0UGZ6_9EURY|nr:molybdopterin-dependent oxidoreductase [Halogeometricum borinquense]QIB74500.1 molybdopterin-dependent oxidoreductase [Halogeometricum borinquense]